MGCPRGPQARPGVGCGRQALVEAGPCGRPPTLWLHTALLLPLAATAASRALVETFRAKTRYFNTYASSPLQAAVGMAVLDEIEQRDVRRNVTSVGAALKAALTQRKGTSDTIGDVRGHGLFFGAELVLDRQARTPAPLETRRIVNQMKDRGILLSNIGVHDNILKMRPPLTFSRDHADLLLSTLDDILAKV